MGTRSPVTVTGTLSTVTLLTVRRGTAALLMLVDVGRRVAVQVTGVGTTSHKVVGDFRVAVRPLEQLVVSLQ